MLLKSAILKNGPTVATSSPRAIFPSGIADLPFGLWRWGGSGLCWEQKKLEACLPKHNKGVHAILAALVFSASIFLNQFFLVLWE